LQTFFCGCLGEDGLDPLTGSILARQECDTGGVGPTFGQIEFDDRTQEVVRNRYGQASTVATRRLGTGGTAMVHVVQSDKGVGN
jgi:hypothetical protein